MTRRRRGPKLNAATAVRNRDPTGTARAAPSIRSVRRNDEADAIAAAGDDDD